MVSKKHYIATCAWWQPIYNPKDLYIHPACITVNCNLRFRLSERISYCFVISQECVWSDSINDVYLAVRVLRNA